MPNQYTRGDYVPKPMADRFWPKVRKSDDPDGCWIWTGANNGKYGVLGSVQNWRKMVYAHRAGYELQIGPIPEGHFALHRCDTPLCVRGDHLFTGTQADNMADKSAKGRHHARTKPWVYRRNEQHASAKLTWKEVDEIRARFAPGQAMISTLAREYSVSRAAIQSIIKGKTWRRDVPRPPFLLVPNDVGDSGMGEDLKATA
jgi:hypothetical protein